MKKILKKVLKTAPKAEAPKVELPKGFDPDLPANKQREYR
jgi:hypothetical protein